MKPSLLIAAFRKVVVFLMLMSAPLAQARAIDVCDMMGGEVEAADCCCESTHQRMPDQSAPDACCTVSVEFGGFAAVAVGSFDHSLPRAHGDHGGDTPSFACASHSAIVVAFTDRAPFVAPAKPSDRASARSLYLTTARLRL